jgi:hypothetical protein
MSKMNKSKENRRYGDIEQGSSGLEHRGKDLGQERVEAQGAAHLHLR